MKVGTKSLLFGVHQFLLHPFFVWLGWLKLYGWTWDPRIFVCITVHDWGYWGKPNMDKREGKCHAHLGAWIAHKLFDKPGSNEWMLFCLLHSRSIARNLDSKPSRLCHADKYGVTMMPVWLLVVLSSITGEIFEYMHQLSDHPSLMSRYGWWRAVLGWNRIEVLAFKDMSLREILLTNSMKSNSKDDYYGKIL